MRKLLIFAVAVSALALGTAANAHAAGADVIVVVDESGSMSLEHAWIDDMIASLDTALAGAGVTDNRYALVGFGSANPAPRTVGGYGNVAAFSAAAGTLLLNGGTEDGYAGMRYGIDTLGFRADAAKQIILITDEDRDNLGTLSGAQYDPYRGFTYGNTLTSLTGVKLNAVVDNPFAPGNALGVDADGFAYQAGPGGTFVKVAGGVAGNGFGTTETDYVPLAWATGGAAWDLEKLRAGGDTATSFTNAFVAIKVEEIKEDIVPEPATMVLMGLGLAGLGVRARRRSRA